jgi:CitMHS family citrate-Mg2+:H+ or citrate-Ca2+:H+ symporter
MYLHIAAVLGVMAVAYAAARLRKLSVELCMLASAVAGGLAGAFVQTPPIGELARHLVEGTFTYLDVMLVFATATIFIAIVAESGGINFIVRGIVRAFHGQHIIALLLLMVVILIPGALTGAGSVSLLTVGAPSALAMGYLGLSKKRTAAILFIVAGLSAAAPPVNIWAMVICAGTAIPYVGFTYTLGIPVLLLGTFTVLTLGWKREHPISREDALLAMPQPPSGMSWWRVLLPFGAFFCTVAASRLWPFSTPVLGLPLQFSIAALVALVCSPTRVNILTLSRDTVRRLVPLLATMAIVGSLQQIMTVTGVRGFISYAVISTSLVLLYLLLVVLIPVSEGLLAYGAAKALFVSVLPRGPGAGRHGPAHGRHASQRDRRAALGAPLHRERQRREGHGHRHSPAQPQRERVHQARRRLSPVLRHQDAVGGQDVSIRRSGRVAARSVA